MAKHRHFNPPPTLPTYGLRDSEAYIWLVPMALLLGSGVLLYRLLVAYYGN